MFFTTYLFNFFRYAKDRTIFVESVAKKLRLILELKIKISLSDPKILKNLNIENNSGSGFKIIFFSGLKISEGVWALATNQLAASEFVRTPQY